MSLLKTEILAIDPNALDGDVIARAAAVFQAGGLVAFPTETVYGLGANALSETAVRGIYRAKGRALDDPCIVHIAQIDDLQRVADLPRPGSPLAARAELLADTFWPGPLSLVLPRAATIPDIVTAGRPTVAVRMPAHPVPLALIRAAGVPIAAPSANTFMHTSPTTAQHVRDDLAGRIDLLLDGGPTPVGVESTVLDLSGPEPVLLRPGGISLERLESVLGPIHRHPIAGRRDEESAGPLAAPGLLPTHYAPHAETILFDGPREPVREALADLARSLCAAGRTVGVLVTDGDAGRINPETIAGLIVARLGADDDLDGIAQRLFAALRELEARGVEVILAHTVGHDGLGRAIDDRLTRAAGGRVRRVTAD